MARLFKAGVAAAVVAAGAVMAAQGAAPEIAYDAVDLLRTPIELYVGEVGGVGQNSKGQIFVYTRTGHPVATAGDNRTFSRGGSRLFQFDRNGKYERELGQDVYGFNAAFGLRVDPQDNVWTIDELAGQVVKFDPEGRIALVLGRKPEAIAVRPAVLRAQAAAAVKAAAKDAAQAEGPGAVKGAASEAVRVEGPALVKGAARAPAGAALPGAGTPGSTFSRPSDVAWDRAGNIYIADGMGNTNRVAKYDKEGRFIRQWGSTGAENGQFNGVKSVAIDAQGNVYVADAGNKRVQVFDADGNYKSQFGQIGTPLTMCITGGATQHLYISHSGDPNGMDDAAIYKVQLDGRVVGKFGSAGRLVKQFGLANSIDCRNENELLVGEMTNWRVQKVSLRTAR